MASSVSIANSIKFRLIDGQLASFDNTFVVDEDWLGAWNYIYEQIFYDDDDFVIQVKVTKGYTISPFYSKGCNEAWIVWDASPTLERSTDDYDFYEIIIDMSVVTGTDRVTFKLDIYTAVPALDETWISEPIKLIEEGSRSDLLQIEYFNYENEYEMDYTANGITSLLRIPSKLKEYSPSGDQDVYENQDELTKVRDVVKRQLTFLTQGIPRYLSEMLTVAASMDKFFINEVEFVSEEKPDIENEKHNLVTFKLTVTQRNVIGLNTNDIGFDCDAICTDVGVINRQALAVSGSGTFAVPEGYSVAFFHVVLASGTTGVFKCGFTVSEDDIIPSMTINSTTRTEIDALKFQTDDIDAAATIYYNVSGVGVTANLYLALIRLKEV